MPDNALIERDIAGFLDRFGGNYIAAYNEIVADQERKVLAERPRSNAALRKAAYAKAVHLMDRKELDSMRRTAENFLPLVEQNSSITAETGILTEDEAEDLMIEVLEVKRLKELADSRYEAIRRRVFNSLTESFAAEGEEFPEQVPGYIEVTGLGLKFTREGGGRKEPDLDEDKLEELVGSDVWEQVTTVETIPAQEVRHFNVDLFLDLARSRPELLEKLRESLIVGGFKPVKFHQRPMESDEE